MDNDWDLFISKCQDALGELVEGRPEPFKALWSHADDVVIMGAFGGYERGWDEVGARLDWASAGIKATGRVADELPLKDDQQKRPAIRRRPPAKRSAKDCTGLPARVG